jgi:hypothetical protein
MLSTVVAMGCGSTESYDSGSYDDTSYDDTDPRSYIENHPELTDTLEEGQAVMSDVGDAADIGSITLLASACSDLSSYAEDALIQWADAPLPYFVASLGSLAEAADACLEGDFETMATDMQSATSLTAQQVESLKG